MRKTRGGTAGYPLLYFKGKSVGLRGFNPFSGMSKTKTKAYKIVRYGLPLTIGAKT